MDPFMRICLPKQKQPIIFIEYCFGILVKLPLFILMIFELIITNDIIFPIIRCILIKPILKKCLRIFILLHNYIVGRFTLLILGYFKYKSLFNGNNLDVKHKNLQSHCFYTTRTSPIDQIVLITYFSPAFTQVHYFQSRVKFTIIPYCKAIIGAFFEQEASFKHNDEGEELSVLVDRIIQNRTGPLILFYEGGVTNGYSFLEMDKAFIEAEKNLEILIDKKYKKEFNFNKIYKSIFIIQHDDRMKTLGCSSIECLQNILINSFCTLEMNFKDFRGGLPKFEEYIVQNLELGISQRNWHDFEERFQH